MKEELKALGLSDSDLKGVSGGVIVAEAGNQKYWLVRQNGTVISPVPTLEKAQEFAKAYGISTKVLTRDEYKAMFGRELTW